MTSCWKNQRPTSSGRPRCLVTYSARSPPGAYSRTSTCRAGRVGWGAAGVHGAAARPPRASPAACPADAGAALIALAAWGPATPSKPPSLRGAPSFRWCPCAWPGPAHTSSAHQVRVGEEHLWGGRAAGAGGTACEHPLATRVQRDTGALLGLSRWQQEAAPRAGRAAAAQRSSSSTLGPAATQHPPPAALQCAGAAASCDL